MKPIIALTTALILASTALAHQGVKDPGVMARMNAMGTVGKAMNTLKDYANAKVTYDPGQAALSKADILTHLRKSEALFEAPHGDPKSEALPVIWQDFSAFQRELRASELSVRKLDVSTLGTLRATLPAAGQGCSDCHKKYRLKK